MYIQPVEESVFKKEIKLHFENILEGFNKYKNVVISPRYVDDIDEVEKRFVKFIETAFVLNEGNVYVDFYLESLDEQSYKRLYNSLNVENKQLLKEFKENNYCTKYFKIIDERILKFFIELCTKELFFITFYFIKYPLTIWGNYNYKFPVFYISDNEFDIYKYSLEKNNIIF